MLKVSWHYLSFWLKYSLSLNKLLTCQIEMMMMMRERERELSDFSGCLAIATVGQKAAVGQGMPNKS